MPIYQPEPENDSASSIERQAHQSFGCSVLHFGPVALYRAEEVLERDISRLMREGFEIRRLDSSRWESPSAVHHALKEALSFPDHYGANLNALRDSLLDIPIPDDGGVAIVLLNYHEFTNRDRDHATGVLDAIAGMSRLLQLFGKSLIALVQTDDPDADYGKLGAVSAWWNSDEFLRERRRGGGTS